MAIQYINTGTSPNSGNGDTLRLAFTKINHNFGELYSDLLSAVPSAVGEAGRLLASDGSKIIWVNAPSSDLLISGTYTFALSTSGNITLNGEPVLQQGYTGSGGTETYVSDIAPITTATGALWFNSTTGRTYIRFDNAWVDASPNEPGYTGSAGPMGYAGSMGYQGVIGYAGSVGPQGCLGYVGSQGNPGADGTSVRIVDSVADASELAVYDTSVLVLGDGIIQEDTGHLQVWTGSSFSDVGQVKGDQGYTGSQGCQGPQGCAGYAGSAGSIGCQGPMGYTGSGGNATYVSNTAPIELNTGTLWFNSITGRTYVRFDDAWVDSNPAELGYTGSIGYAGSAGPIGPQGCAGNTGFAGSIGFTGSAGICGSQGCQGYTGSQGYCGSQGDIGYTGSAGICGSQGCQGYTGSQGYCGSQGDIGYTGSQGICGYTGSVGFTGSQGYCGSQGCTGYTGSIGACGYTGSTGYVGSQGIRGDNGTSVTIIGSVADINDLNAYNTSGLKISDGLIQKDTGHLHVWTGNSWDDVGNIIGYTGSQGVIGYTGSLGDTGYVGSQGDLGYTGSLGYSGSLGYCGSQGYTGSQGDLGYTGSQGDLGYAGSQGDLGYAGSQGDLGYAGSQGDLGYVGSQGYTGSQGDLGYVGSQGYTGSQGDLGYAGSRGYTGSQGDLGYAGSIGYVGSVGTSTFTTNRINITGRTSTLANRQTGTVVMSGFRTYVLSQMSTSVPAWVRVYSDAVSQSADASRPSTTDPLAGSGLLVEVITTPSILTQRITPGVMGYNLDVPTNGNIYATVTNLSGASNTVTVTLTILQLEA
jgi:hypothetical protein